MMDIVIRLWSNTVPVSPCPQKTVQGLVARSPDFRKVCHMAGHAIDWMPKFCRHWISNRLHRCERTRPETSTVSGVGSCTHVTAQRAPHCCVMRQEMEPIQSKCVNTEATWVTHRTFSRKSLYNTQSKNHEEHGEVSFGLDVSITMWCGNATGSNHLLAYQLRPHNSARLWNVTQWLAAVPMKQLQPKQHREIRKAVMPRGNGDIMCQVDTDWKYKADLAT